MDFRYGTDQVDFRQSVRDFLRDAAPLPRVRQIATPPVMTNGCGSGYAVNSNSGLHVPVEYGGAGATLVESSIAFEGTRAPLTPPLATHMFAVNAILLAGNEGSDTACCPDYSAGRGLRLSPTPRRCTASTPRTVWCSVACAVRCCTGTWPMCSWFGRPRRLSVVLAAVAADSTGVSAEELPRSTSPVRWPARDVAGRRGQASSGRRTPRIGPRMPPGAARRRNAQRRRSLPRALGRLCPQQNTIRSRDRIVSGGQAHVRRHADRDRRDPGGGHVPRR